MQVEWVIVKKIHFYFRGISGRHVAVDCKRCLHQWIRQGFLSISFAAVVMAVAYFR